MKSAECNITLHRFPEQQADRQRWLDGLKLADADITAEARVCSLHFRDGNSKTIPSLHIGMKFSGGLQPDTA